MAQDTTTTIDGLHLAYGLDQGTITIEPAETELRVQPSLGDISDDDENAWLTTEMVIREGATELARLEVWVHCAYAAPERDLRGGLDETHGDWEWQVSDGDGAYSGRPRAIDDTQRRQHHEGDPPAHIEGGEHMGGSVALSLTTDAESSPHGLSLTDESIEALETIQAHLNIAYERIDVPDPSDEDIRTAIRDARGRFGFHPYAWHLYIVDTNGRGDLNIGLRLGLDIGEADEERWEQVSLYTARVHNAPMAFAGGLDRFDEPEVYVGEGCVLDAIHDALELMGQRMESAERSIRDENHRKLAEQIKAAESAK